MSDTTVIKTLKLYLSKCIGIALLGVFIVFVAPFQVFNETEQRRLLLKALDDKELRQRMLNLLWDLRQKGVEIHNEYPENIANWHRLGDEWRHQILDGALFDRQ